MLGKVCALDKAREWKETYSKQCECVRRKKIARLMAVSGIPNEFEKLLFGNLRTVNLTRPKTLVSVPLNNIKIFLRSKKEIKCRSSWRILNIRPFKSNFRMVVLLFILV